MSLTSLGDLAQSLVARRNLTATKIQVQKYSKEMTSGISSDVAKHLRGDLGPLDAVRNSLAQFKGYKVTTTDLQLYSGAMQSALTQLDDLATDLAAPLLSAGASNSLIAADIVGSTTSAKFSAAVGLINTSLGGRSVFSGKATDKLPLPDGGQILDQIKSVVAGATSAGEVENLIRGWFDSPAGYQALYSGADPMAPVAISNGETAALGVTAMSEGVVETLKGLAMASMLENEDLGLSGSERALLARSTGQYLTETQQQRADMRASLASVENRISSAQSQNTAAVSALELTQIQLIGIDPEEAAVRLTDAETRLQLIYTVIGRLSSLSLSNYIR